MARLSLPLFKPTNTQRPSPEMADPRSGLYRPAGLSTLITRARRPHQHRAVRTRKGMGKSRTIRPSKGGAELVIIWGWPQFNTGNQRQSVSELSRARMAVSAGSNSTAR